MIETREKTCKKQFILHTYGHRCYLWPVDAGTRVCVFEHQTQTFFPDVATNSMGKGWNKGYDDKESTSPGGEAPLESFEEALVLSPDGDGRVRFVKSPHTWCIRIGQSTL